jgi:DNA-binding NtrC family response regulator/predicted hydrocarbon binding protein
MAEANISDLFERLTFRAEQGEIWLDQQRMLLLHLSAFASFRRELVDALGATAARGLLTRMGYAAGSRDAEFARRVRSDAKLMDAFSVGPALHSLEGLVVVEPVEIDIDVERGVHHVEQLWHNSAEASAHLSLFGVSGIPVCWMQIGYASGYNSAFFGRSIIFRETECCGMGHEHCRIVGRPAEEWDDAGEDISFLRPTSFVNRSLIEKGTSEDFARNDMIGASPGFVSTCRQLERVAPTSATVLFFGETGVGKEKFARLLHKQSRRHAGPFIPVNCGAIPENLLEAELFGVEKGAFTGAVATRAGRFERADGGTLFLDEIGTLPLAAQQKLLRVLQEREIERVGGTSTRKVDIRLVAATNANLRAEVDAGRFREDLFYRVNVVPISIPPLRERRDDIPLLISYFTKRFSAEHGLPMPSYTARAIDTLLTHPYPGNIRELENLVERGVIMVPPGEAIDLPHLFANEERREGPAVAGAAADDRRAAAQAALLRGSFNGKAEFDLARVDLQDARTLEDAESAFVAAALDFAGGNMAAGAKLIGLTRRQMEYRVKRYRGQLPSGFGDV